VRLREVMDEHRRRTGERMTYEQLAKLTGLSRPTLESLATRETYDTRLSTIAKLCRVLGCQPGELLELVPEGKRAAQDR
jgi:putative transcriptional regulator